jgi:hypothetical protein
MINLSKRVFTLFALFIFTTIHIGCLSPIAIRAAGGAAGGAAPSSFNDLGKGEGESYFIARYDDVTKAASKAAGVLSLEPKEKEIKAGQTTLRYSSGKTNQIKLIIERRTVTMTSITFDVGWFGSMALSRLMAQQIIYELEQAGAFLVHWNPERAD